MRVLVTGGSGFLGAHLCRALAAAGHDVVVPSSRDADLRRPGTLDAYRGPFDRIFHLAAWTQAGDFCLRHPGEQWLINQQIHTNVLVWWQARQPQAKLVAIGTSCAYPETGSLTEDRYDEGRPTESLYTYAMTKRMLLVGMRALEKQYGFEHLTLVPSTLYGPDYHLDGRQMHFIFDLVRKIVEAAAGGPPPVLWGDGHQRREIVHVGDFVEAALRLADAVDNDVVNIGAGEDFSIRDFAATISRLAGYDAERIVYDTSRYVGARSKVLDVAKLRRLLPDWTPRPLEAGLRETIAWFRRGMA